MEFASPAGVPWRGKSAEAPSADSLRASGPYGHNTLTGLYFTPYSFNQSTGHILCPSMHEFVCPFQKFVFIRMHLPLFSVALLLLCLSRGTLRFHICRSLHGPLYNGDRGWMFNPVSPLCDKTLIMAAQ